VRGIEYLTHHRVIPQEETKPRHWLIEKRRESTHVYSKKKMQKANYPWSERRIFFSYRRLASYVFYISRSIIYEFSKRVLIGRPGSSCCWKKGDHECIYTKINVHCIPTYDLLRNDLCLEDLLNDCVLYSNTSWNRTLNCHWTHVVVTRMRMSCESISHTR